MQLFTTSIVVLVFFIVEGKGLERSTGKKVAWGKQHGMRPTVPNNQRNYEIVLKKLEMDVVYGDHISELTRFDVVMYNETKSVISGVLHVLKDLPPNMKVQVKGSRFSNTNQWIPVFDQGVLLFCEYYETNVSFMKNILDASNIKECPIVKGQYTMKNMVVDEKGFPPGIPNSEFKLDATFTIDKKQLARVSVYANVQQKDDDDDDD